MSGRCLWCARPFTVRKVGAHAKKFCSVPCKDRYHTALSGTKGPLWVISRRLATTYQMSAFGGKADTKSLLSGTDPIFRR